MKRLYHFLREVREEKGYSQEEVAEKLNVSLKTIYRYEKGEIIPKLKFLQKFAEIMSTSEEERKELYTKLFDLRNAEIKLLRRKLELMKTSPSISLEDVVISEEGESLNLLSERILSDMKKKGITSSTLVKITGIDILRLRGILLGEEPPSLTKSLKKLLKNYFEEEANLFARELLVPYSFLKQAIFHYNIRDIHSLAEFFNVSEQVMSIKVQQYNLFDYIVKSKSAIFSS